MGLGSQSGEGVGQGYGLPPAGQDTLIMVSEPATLGTAAPAAPPSSAIPRRRQQ